jgi:formylglycine-generating enzyme required for sulfatase activity
MFTREWHERHGVISMIPVVVFIGVVSSHAPAGAAPAGSLYAQAGAVFRDCPDCPEMVTIPAGQFTMGSAPAEKSWAARHGGSLESVADEAPQHRVSLRSFAMGKYDVTRSEYAAFVRETGYSSGSGCYESSMPKSNKNAQADWARPGFEQTDRDPVVCVNWHDARAYVSWLNRNLRHAASGDGPYRLPTEAEWEYAARAGTTTKFWWGEDESGAGSHAWYSANSSGKTHPVGAQPANPFGLYDVAGNVWQWTEDCYDDSYAHAPTDGTANTGAKECLRVDRGSAWTYPAWLLRPAARERNPSEYRDVIMGFRVARTLE